jgi:hypothetical protein
MGILDFVVDHSSTQRRSTEQQGVLDVGIPIPLSLTLTRHHIPRKNDQPMRMTKPTGQ